MWHCTACKSNDLYLECDAVATVKFGQLTGPKGGEHQVECNWWIVGERWKDEPKAFKPIYCMNCDKGAIDSADEEDFEWKEDR